jgi:acetyl esterase/lipase
VQDQFTPSPETLERLMLESVNKPPPPGPVHLDLPYRRTLLRTHRLDIYEPTVSYESGTAPVVLFLHGGSWIKGDKITIRVVDRFLARMREQGYFVIAVNYTTSPLKGLSGPLKNVKEAIRWIGDHAGRYGYDPERLGLYGVSAGGHLALMAVSTMEPEQVRFSFAFVECAPTDLIGMRNGDAFENARVFKLFPEGRLRELSPINYVSKELPPILIFHGDADRTVHIDQSVRYVEAVQSVGGEAELVRYPGGDHVFLNYSDAMWYRQETRALEFFEEQF